MAKARYQHRHGTKANLSASDVLSDEAVIVDSGDTPSSSAMYYKPSGGGLVRLANYSDVENNDSMLLMNSVPQSVSDWKRGQIGWDNNKPVIKTGVGSETTTVPLALESSVDSKLANKADKETTLAGYGITDAYTRTAVDASLANKADKETTLSGYGITDAYTQAQINSLLNGKTNVQHVQMGEGSFPNVDTAIDNQTAYVCRNSGGGITGWLFFNGSAGFAAGVAVSQILFDRTGDIRYRVGKSRGSWQPIDWSESEWKTFAKTTDLANKADKETTLAGYGITDAYTQTEINSLLTDKYDIGYVYNGNEPIPDNLIEIYGDNIIHIDKAYNIHKIFIIVGSNGTRTGLLLCGAVDLANPRPYSSTQIIVTWTGISFRSRTANTDTWTAWFPIEHGGNKDTVSFSDDNNHYPSSKLVKDALAAVHINNRWLGKNYISHGDSITWQDGNAYIQGEHEGEIAVGYQTVLKNTFGLATVNNRGLSGYTMAFKTPSSYASIVNLVKNTNYNNCDLCTILGGSNDFMQDIPIGAIGNINDTNYDTTTFYGAYREAIDYILTQKLDIYLVLITPPQKYASHRHPGYDVNTVNGAGHRLIDYVNAVKQLGEMYSLPVCDLYGGCGITKKTSGTFDPNDPTNDVEGYTMDGLHPNDKGYERIALLLEKSL